MSVGAGQSLVRAVVFVDISGSTRLYKELGDEAALRRVRGCLSVLSQVIGDQQGRMVKEMGDGLLCEFADPDRAMMAAEAMQLAVAGEDSDGQPRLGIHVGCHFGPVIENSGDLFGDTVNVAARLAGVARQGQIIATLALVERLNPVLRLQLRPLEAISVRGHNEPLTVFDYLCTESHGERTVVIPAAASQQGSRLKVVCGDREVWLHRTGTCTLALGRSADCELAVNDPAASRRHATIEVRGEKFVLVDHSSNGTYVSWEGATETRLRHEELILPARGRIGLGSSTAAEQATVVEFSRER